MALGLRWIVCALAASWLACDRPSPSPENELVPAASGTVEKDARGPR